MKKSVSLSLSAVARLGFLKSCISDLLMASKRPAASVSAEAGTSGMDSCGKESDKLEGQDGPPSCKKTAIIPAVSLGKVATSEEMDKRVLIFQNRKLAQQLEAQKDKEDELQKRINDMEQVQELNDETLSTVTKYWIQVKCLEK